MTFSTFDIMLPIGLAAVFAVFRYTQHLKADPPHALPRAGADFVKGAFGLAVVTLGYKWISQT